MIDSVLNYLYNGGLITFFVLGLLSIYFILIIWIFSYKYMFLTTASSNEKKSLQSLINTTAQLNPLSALSRCTNLNGEISKEVLSACEISLIREASTGISWLSIVSSTAPFIGLFGTVVGILESFAQFSTESKVNFSIIAPVISEALVATAAGIFVAIFAYTFHQILTRKIYEFDTYIKAQIKILVSKR